MKHKHTLLAAVVSASLAACGGSGGSAETVSNPGGNTPTTPPPPVQQTLTWKAIKSNHCGIETPQRDAWVVFHDQSGVAISSHKTDEQGLVSVDIPDNAVHVSTFGYEDRVLYREPLQQDVTVRTLLNYVPEKLQTEYYFFDNDNTDCACDVRTLDLSELTQQYSDAYFRIGSTVTRLSSSSSISYEFCENKPDYDIYVYAQDRSYMQAGLLTREQIADKTAIALTDLSIQATPVEVDAELEIETSYRWVTAVLGDSGSRQGFSNVSNNVGESVFYVPEMSDLNFLRVGKRTSLSVQNIDFELRKSARERINVDGSHAPIEFYENDSLFMDEIVNLTNDFAAESWPARYDFSRVTDDALSFRFTTEWREDDRYFFIDVTGDVSGSIPDIRLTPELEQLIIAPTGSLDFDFSIAGGYDYSTFKEQYDGLDPEIEAANGFYRSEKYASYRFIGAKFTANN